MLNLKNLICLAAGALSLPLMHAHAQVITQWTFENDSVAVNNNPATSTGTGTADSIGMNLYPTPNVGVTTDDVTKGKSSDTGANGVADTTNTWRVRGQAGTNGAANGWSSQAPIATQGAQFFASTAGKTTGAIQVTFDWYATSAGEANLQFEYTTDGGTTWNNLALTLGGSDTGLTSQDNTNPLDTNTVQGFYVSDNSLLNAKGGQDWFTGLTVTINNAAVLNDAGFGIEMVNASTGSDDVNTGGTALDNSSGNWRFDNITIADVAAIPEPGTYALMFGGLAFLGLVVRFRANRLS